MANFGKLDFNISLKPTSAFPLDARCYFESYDDALAAAETAEEAGSTNTIYYFGQKLLVVENGTATWYTIQPDNTLLIEGSGNSDDGNSGGSGDMLKSVYDTNNNGKVDKADDAEKFGGQLPSYYATASSLSNYVSKILLGEINGVATLDVNGTLPISQLPTHTHSDLEDAVDDLNDTFIEAIDHMTEIASGKCSCYVFDTVAALDADLAEYVTYITDETEMSEENAFYNERLKTGDVFLIRAVDVPDYWWDASTNRKWVLETTKVDLSTISNADIDNIVK